MLIFAGHSYPHPHPPRHVPVTIDRGLYLLLFTLSFPGMIQGLEGEGMCNFRNRDLKGNLYFVFDIEFPENGFLEVEKIEVGGC